MSRSAFLGGPEEIPVSDRERNRRAESRPGVPRKQNKAHEGGARRSRQAKPKPGEIKGQKRGGTTSCVAGTISWPPRPTHASSRQQKYDELKIVIAMTLEGGEWARLNLACLAEPLDDNEFFEDLERVKPDYAEFRQHAFAYRKQG